MTFRGSNYGVLGSKFVGNLQVFDKLHAATGRTVQSNLGKVKY